MATVSFFVTMKENGIVLSDLLERFSGRWNQD
jgi:hypothetical protein